MSKAKKKKDEDRSKIEQKLGRATHEAGKAELLLNKTAQALDAVAKKELADYNEAQNNLQACQAKIVEINEQLIALDK